MDGQKVKAIEQKIILEDTTLRDGEQAPGVSFSKTAKLEIFNALLDIGVKWIEIGIPAMGGEELESIIEMLERKEEGTLVAWNRGRREDIQQSIDLGFNALHIGLPTSEIHLKSSVGKDRGWLLREASDLIKLAKDAGKFVSISAEDVGRTEPGFLMEYAAAVTEAGADRLRLSDTIGILGPDGYAERVRTVKRVSNIDAQCHCHNDFGLAVANTLAGLEAGATYFHVCVNGMGERAGMPDLAAVAMSLKHFYGVDLGLDLTRLKSLSEVVATHCRRPVLPWYPVVGDNVFAHESGIHSKGMLNNAKTFEPFAPELVGGVRRIVIGKHCGKTAIRHVLEQNNVVVDPALLDTCLQQVRARAIRIGGEVHPAELVDIYVTLMSQLGQDAKSAVD